MVRLPIHERRYPRIKASLHLAVEAAQRMVRVGLCKPAMNRSFAAYAEARSRPLPQVSLGRYAETFLQKVPAETARASKRSRQSRLPLIGVSLNSLRRAPHRGTRPALQYQDR